MRIRTITLDRFKVTSEVQLGHLNCLIGPNGAGKTAYLQGLQFLIEGRSVAGGRAEDAIHLATSPSGCGVAIMLDDGRGLGRHLRKDARKVTVSQSLSVPGCDPRSTGVRECEAALKAIVGDFAPAFDLGTFLGLSPDKRREAVVALVPGNGAADPHDLGTQVALQTLKDKLGEGMVEQACQHQFNRGADDLVPAERAAVVLGLGTELAESEWTALQASVEAIKQQKAESVEGWIGLAIQICKARQNASKRDRDEAQAAGRRLSAQKAEIEVAAGSEAKMKDDLAEFRTQRGEIQSQLDHQAGRAESEASLRRQIEILAQRAAYTEQQLAHQQETVPDEGHADAWALEAAELLAEIEDPAADDAAMETLRATLTSATTEQLDAAQAETEAKAEGYRLQRAVVEQLKRVEQAKADPWTEAVRLCSQVERVFDRMDQRLRHTGLWEAIEQLREHLRAQADDLPALEAEHEKLAHELHNAAQAFNGKKDASKAAADRLEGTRVKIRAAEELSRYAQQAAFQARTRAGELRASADRVRTEAAAQRAQVVELTGALATRRGESVERQRELDRLLESGSVPTADLEQQRTGLTQQIKELEQQIKDKQKAATLDEQLANAIARAEQEEVAHEMAGQVIKAIRVLRETMMADLVAPLMSRINDFLSVALPGHEAYCTLESDRGKAIFDVGWTVNGEYRVPLPAMSGGESALFCAGLAFALVSLADVPLRLLLIEAGELDDRYFSRLLLGLQTVCGDFSNVIVCRHGVAPPADSCWNVVPVGQTAPEPQGELAACPQ